MAVNGQAVISRNASARRVAPVQAPDTGSAHANLPHQRLEPLVVAHRIEARIDLDARQIERAVAELAECQIQSADGYVDLSEGSEIFLGRALRERAWIHGSWPRLTVCRESYRYA